MFPPRSRTKTIEGTGGFPAHGLLDRDALGGQWAWVSSGSSAVKAMHVLSPGAESSQRGARATTVEAPAEAISTPLPIGVGDVGAQCEAHRARVQGERCSE
jgi:hypothetical protein